MAKKHVYREGDHVRVVNSRFIRRVGYDLHPDDLRDEMAGSERFRAALKALGYASMRENRAYRKLLDAVLAEVHMRGFGSRERKLHYYPTVAPGKIRNHDQCPDLTGAILSVDGKRCVQTGTYFAPWSDQTYEGEYEYEPGGLTNPRTHILLKTVYGEIEACDVEPAANAQMRLYASLLHGDDAQPEIDPADWGTSDSLARKP